MHRKLIVLCLILVSFTAADVLRRKGTGEPVAKGTRTRVEKGTIYWTNCDNTTATFKEADYVVILGDHCGPPSHNATNAPNTEGPPPDQEPAPQSATSASTPAPGSSQQQTSTSGTTATEPAAPAQQQQNSNGQQASTTGTSATDQNSTTSSSDATRSDTAAGRSKKNHARKHKKTEEHGAAGTSTTQTPPH